MEQPYFLLYYIYAMKKRVNHIMYSFLFLFLFIFFFFLFAALAQIVDTLAQVFRIPDPNIVRQMADHLGLFRKPRPATIVEDDRLVVDHNNLFVLRIHPLLNLVAGIQHSAH
uniref:Uncharacterized protein n=1 Tax=Cacopsylla melanoneura TaxID=428564 RepID=A0A8D8T7J3_9HEMI